MVTIAMMLGLLFVTVLGAALALWACARLVGAGSPSLRRALACSLVLAIMGFGVQLALAALSVRDATTQIVVAGVQFVVALALTWWMTAWFFHITFPRAMLLSLPYFALTIPATFGTVYVVKNYCMEAFVIPTSNMAPTFFGWHHEAICPHCGARVIIPGRPPGDDFERIRPAFDEPRPGICTQCRKISMFEKRPEEVHTPTRIICNKLMQPQRGDAIVFVHPRRFDDEEKHLSVMRLIGLPGEKIEIKNDAVWINGDKWTPPTELSGLVYHPTAMGSLPLPGEQLEPRTWELGPDDFFVLGDFTTNSSDSRDWGPVPRQNLIGPVTMIYWPPSACRILR